MKWWQVLISAIFTGLATWIFDEFKQAPVEEDTDEDTKDKFQGK
jgi:hypothetical protein